METLIRFEAGTLPPDTMISPVVFGRDAFSRIDVGDIDLALIDDDAVLPDPARRRLLTAEERIVLSAFPDTPHPRVIECITPPDDLLEAVAKCQERIGTPRQQKALGKLAVCAAMYGAKYINRGHCPPNRLVATVYPGTKQAPALHVDDRGRLPSEFRMGSRRRLGINAGPGIRWLLVCLPDILSMGTEKNDLIPQNNQFKRFARVHTEDIQCLWIPIPPMTAWVAGTDMVAHDGGTYGQEESTGYFFLGHWKRGFWRDKTGPGRILSSCA